MTKTSDGMAFRYQKLARHALVKHFKGSDAHVSGMSREERFALYAELDQKITDEAFRLLRERGGEIEPLFDEAAITVVSNL